MHFESGTTLHMLKSTKLFQIYFYVIHYSSINIAFNTYYSNNKCDIFVEIYKYTHVIWTTIDNVKCKLLIILIIKRGKMGQVVNKTKL